ncbi:carbohydrate ABC transporter permease [Paenibacillus sp. HB172176]|uniref:carbohydrate ABC transporter permease n=1 Tax=Paenibacillus sp. HB172176 TaxID=2493690 RepID=UPI001F0FBFFE|nr:carbohydrate ABC transporter permease [Paenibacillus sp. HB172176]
MHVLMKLIRKSPGAYLTHFVMIATGLIWIYPFIWMITASFKTNAEYISEGAGLIPHKIQFGNYFRAWETANFSVYFINSVIVTLCTVLAVIVVCSLTGYVLGRYPFPGKMLFIVLITATMFMPKGFTLIPVYTLINSMGLNNSLSGVILAEIGSAHVLFILLFTAHFRGLPRDLEEAAEVDGYGFIRTFFSVMLPLSKPIIATTGIMQFMYSWNSFLIPLVFTLQNEKIRTLGVGMYQFVGENSVDWVGMAAGACISLIPIILVFIFFQKYFVEGVAGAVKG